MNLLRRRLLAIKGYENVGCPDCGYPFWWHNKERVYHDRGRYSYNYNCPSKSDLPADSR